MYYVLKMLFHFLIVPVAKSLGMLLLFQKMVVHIREIILPRQENNFNEIP